MYAPQRGPAEPVGIASGVGASEKSGLAIEFELTTVTGYSALSRIQHTAKQLHSTALYNPPQREASRATHAARQRGNFMNEPAR